jgi:hypothetical protein
MTIRAAPYGALALRRVIASSATDENSHFFSVIAKLTLADPVLNLGIVNAKLMFS